MLRWKLRENSLTWNFYFPSCVTVLDSWSKVRPGLLSGEYADLGHWDQCVSTVLHENWKSEQVTGQYCLYHLSWPLHESYEEDRAAVSRHSSSWIRHLIDDSDAFRFAKVAAATCIPSTCTRHELQSMVDACKCHKVFEFLSSKPLYKFHFILQSLKNTKSHCELKWQRHVTQWTTFIFPIRVRQFTSKHVDIYSSSW